MAVIVIRDAIITGLRMLAERRDAHMKTRWTAKFKTLSQMFFLYTALIVGVFVETDVWLSIYAIDLLDSEILKWFMYGIVLLTVYSGIEYIIVNRDLFSLKNETKT